MEFPGNELLNAPAKRLRTVVERNLWLICIIAIGVVSRLSLALFLPPGNFDMFALVMLLSLSAGYATRRWAALLVPLGIMGISDIFLYFFSGRIFPYSTGLLMMLAFFVWTGFAMSALLGKATRRTKAPNPFWFAAGGVWSVVLFDTWTNIGWWLGPYYPNTLQGLATCMFMGLPFMIWHMASAMILMPVFYIGVKRIYHYETRFLLSTETPVESLL